MSTLSARAALALVAALVAAASVTATSSAFFPVPQGPVIPNVMFGALVNGASSNAVVRMGCFGAVRPGQTGHPMSGQTVEVFRPEALLVSGFTGTAADHIVARFSEDPAVPVVLHRFARRVAIPTTLVLPCSGAGSVVFSPEPTSAMARNASVSVEFVGQP